MKYYIFVIAETLNVKCSVTETDDYWWVFCGAQLTSRRRREDGTGGQSTSESEADSDFEQVICARRPLLLFASEKIISPYHTSP